MRVQKIQNINNSFKAGKVDLKGIELKDLAQFDKIKQIAEKDKLDLFITKGINSKNLPKNDIYIVMATKEINKLPYISRASSCAVVEKQAEPKDICEKIYDAAIKSVKKLAKNIKRQTGTEPEFLKYMS